jgi:hypothetical protein
MTIRVGSGRTLRRRLVAGNWESWEFPTPPVRSATRTRRFLSAGVRRPAGTTGPFREHVADQVSLAGAPGPPGFRRGVARDPATPPHPERHPCRRGPGLCRPRCCPPGPAAPPDRSDVLAAQTRWPAVRARAAAFGVGCDPRLHHAQCRRFWDPRLESGIPGASPIPTAIRQVAPALLCRAGRVPGRPCLAPVEAHPTVHYPIAGNARVRSEVREQLLGSLAADGGGRRGVPRRMANPGGHLPGRLSASGAAVMPANHARSSDSDLSSSYGRAPRWHESEPPGPLTQLRRAPSRSHRLSAWQIITRSPWVGGGARPRCRGRR